MKIQDRIKNNAEYFRSIEMAGLYPIVRVWFPEKWGVFPSKDERIKITRSEDTANEWYYYTTDETVGLDDMFDLMEQTINVNLSAIAKVELLKVKIEELKHVFSEESLEKLQTLTFKFEDVKKNRRKAPRKKTIDTVTEIKNEIEETVEIDNNFAEEKVTTECLS